MIRAMVVAVGDELLSGRSIERNIEHIAVALRELGARLESARIIGDQIDQIASAAREQFDVLIFTGGLGPTEDDLTRVGIARGLGLKLVESARARGYIFDRLKRSEKIGSMRPVDPMIFNMALAPEGSVVFRPKVGAAPSIYIDQADRAIFLIPGPPAEARSAMALHVIPTIRARFKKRARPIKTVRFRTALISESALAGALSAAGIKSDSIATLAYLPHPGRVDIELKPGARSRSDGSSSRFKARVRALRKIIGAHIYAMGDAPIEEMIRRLFVRARIKLASAESITGGLFASRIISRPGASRYFSESIVAYSDEAKQARLGVTRATLKRYGAVSERVAIEMAVGARGRSGADIAVSSTGIAGPTGASAQKKIGLVYIGLADENGAKAIRCHFSARERAGNQIAAVETMLGELFFHIKGRG